MIKLFEKFTTLIPLILVVALIMLVPIHTAYAANFTVDTTNDTIDANLGDGICADAAGDCSLQAAAYETASLVGPHTITLPADTYTLSSGVPLPFVGDITLNGADAATTIIQAATCDPTAGACGHSHNVLSILLGTVDINNVTIRHGADGGIFNGGTLTITDSIITNNSNTRSDTGGGILNYEGTLSIVDSLVTNNSNTGTGGGGLYNRDEGTVSLIQDSTFSGNSGNSGSSGSSPDNIAGGLYNEGIITTIENSIFSENSGASGTDGAAGGIFNLNFIDTIQNSSFSGNSASGNNGATGGILNGGIISTIENSSFSKNSGTSDTGGAGGIFNVGGIIETIQNVTLSQNSATGTDSIGGLGNYQGTITTINDSTFVRNSGSGASAIYYFRCIPNLFCSGSIGTISNTLIAGNTGGAACDFTLGAPSSRTNNISNDASCGFGTITPMIGIHVDINLADNGCMTPLPDGSCVQTHALLSTASNPAIDSGSGSCPDEREFPQSGTSCDIGAFEIQIANLTAIKSNNISGTGVIDTSFNWSILLANGINQATFNDGQTILSDQLPTTNISYGGVTTSGAVNVTNSGNIACSITEGLLTCTASGDSVIFETGSSISINIPATATATGVYVNPTGGSCMVDPNNRVYETDETDNNCFDIVTVADPKILILEGTVPATEGGADGLLTVVLSSQPTANVTLSFAYTNGASYGAQTSAGTPMTFTTTDWDSPQTISVQAIDDLLVEGTHTDTITVTASSTDTAYNDPGSGGNAVYYIMSNAANGNTVTVDIADNDSAGISVDIIDGVLLDENSLATDTFLLSTTSEPTADVNITLTTDAQCTITSPASGIVTLPISSTTPQTMTVIAVADAVLEGLHTCTITTTADNTTSDTNYNSLNPADVVAAVVDIPGVVIRTRRTTRTVTNIQQEYIHTDELDYITKTVDKTVATGGDTVTYTITAHNPKNIPLTQVVIYDVFDDRFDNVQLVSTTHGSGSFVERTLTVSGFTLQPDERATIIVSAQITTDFRAGEIIPNAAILESPDASVHVSNLVLVGDDVTGNDGDSATVLLFPSELPSTGETPNWREYVLLVLALGSLLIALGTKIILRRRGQV